MKESNSYGRNIAKRWSGRIRKHIAEIAYKEVRR
jgi:hypothetical protein